MSDQQTTTANFCPECGAAVGAAETIAAADEVAVQGVFEQAGAHMVVDGSLIKVFKHAEEQ